jgi:hypothetical protein
LGIPTLPPFPPFCWGEENRRTEQRQICGESTFTIISKSRKTREEDKRTNFKKGSRILLSSREFSLSGKKVKAFKVKPFETVAAIVNKSPTLRKEKTRPPPAPPLPHQESPSFPKPTIQAKLLEAAISVVLQISPRLSPSSSSVSSPPESPVSPLSPKSSLEPTISIQKFTTIQEWERTNKCFSETQKVVETSRRPAA